MRFLLLAGASLLALATPAMAQQGEDFSTTQTDSPIDTRVDTEVGLTSIFVTHDHEEAFTLADRVSILNAGQVEQFATPAEIAQTPASEFVRAFLK